MSQSTPYQRISELIKKTGNCIMYNNNLTYAGRFSIRKYRNEMKRRFDSWE